MSDPLIRRVAWTAVAALAVFRCSTFPLSIAGGLRFAEKSAGATHTCGPTPEGVAYCWGWNGMGQLGDGTTTQRLTPVQVIQ